jgi:hypothetical protein
MVFRRPVERAGSIFQEPENTSHNIRRKFLWLNWRAPSQSGKGVSQQFLTIDVHPQQMFGPTLMFEIFAIWSEIRRAMPQLCTTIASQATGSQAAHPAQLSLSRRWRQWNFCDKQSGFKKR